MMVFARTVNLGKAKISSYDLKFSYDYGFLTVVLEKIILRKHLRLSSMISNVALIVCHFSLWTLRKRADGQYFIIRSYFIYFFMPGMFFTGNNDLVFIGRREGPSLILSHFLTAHEYSNISLKFCIKDIAIPFF